MKENIPRTPFSTPLSGSARVTELRLRNIFSGPKPNGWHWKLAEWNTILLRGLPRAGNRMDWWFGISGQSRISREVTLPSYHLDPTEIRLPQRR